MFSGWRAKSLLTAIIACSAIAAARPAFSQGAPCTADDPTEHLLTKFQERVTAYGTSEAGAVLIRIFANVETGSWTIVLSQAAPPAHCLISAGEGFEILPSGEKPKGTSARYAP